jgi:hypothetical protein
METSFIPILEMRTLRFREVKQLAPETLLMLML